MHQDEGWRSPQPASRGKVVSTKVGCGRFTANVTEHCQPSVRPTMEGLMAKQISHPHAHGLTAVAF
jgi:hypothetical protein